jgi:hypothetical protein
MRKQIIAGIFLLLFTKEKTTHAQDSSKIFFTTGIGYLLPNARLNNAFRSSVALNSGLELTNKKKQFLHFTLEVNTLKYNQQITDPESKYLLQNSNSPFIMLGANAGKNFTLTKRWFLSGYIGGGYVNIGEPRATLNAGNIVKQNLVRSGNIFGRAGSRLTFNTKSNLLHILFADINWWTSPIKVQNASVSGFSFFIGTRMPMY